MALSVACDIWPSCTTAYDPCRALAIKKWFSDVLRTPSREGDTWLRWSLNDWSLSHTGEPHGSNDRFMSVASAHRTEQRLAYVNFGEFMVATLVIVGWGEPSWTKRRQRSALVAWLNPCRITMILATNQRTANVTSWWTSYSWCLSLS